MTWYLDFANLLVCLVAILIALRMKVIPNWIGLVLAIYSFVPYFLNDVLFSATYMSDQFMYFRTLEEVRSFNYAYSENIKGTYTAWLLSILPLPFAETIKSMGFYNRFLFIILFIWLYQKKFLRGMPLFFVLFYPSLVLYSSLTIRDPLIMTMMVVSVILFIDKKYLWSFVVTIPMFFIKFQNFFLMLVFFAIFLIYRKNTLLYKLRYLLVGLIVLGLTPFINEIILLLDYYRGAMFREDGGDMLNYVPLEGIYDLFILGATSLPSSLMKPLPWDASSAFQFIQSIENIGILIFLIFFSVRAYKQDSFVTIKWLLYLSIALTVYGLVVFNFGTAVRYKYPFIVMYVVGLSYELYKLHGYRFKAIFKHNSEGGKI